MFIFRWLSIVFIVTAVMLLGADLIGTLEKKALVIRSLQNVLLLFNYDATQALVANFPPQLVQRVRRDYRDARLDHLLPARLRLRGHRAVDQAGSPAPAAAADPALIRPLIGA